MQSPKKEKKQQQLPPAKGKPEVLQAKVLSPHDIEKEFLLKKIESLQYNVRSQSTHIRQLEQQIFLLQRHEQQIESLRKAEAVLTEKYYKMYTHMANSFVESARNFAKLAKTYIEGEEWKPEVKKFIEANKLPVFLN